MFLSLAHLLDLLQHYGYFILFPIVVVEGPIVTVLAGFLISLGIMHWAIAYVVVVVGDLAGDALHYAVGRWWDRVSWLARIGRVLGYRKEYADALERHFKKHLGKTLILGKISHGVGGGVLIAAGIARVDFRKYMWYNLIATIPKSFLFLLIGYYFGRSYVQIDRYLGYLSLGIALLLIIVYLIIRKTAQRASHD